MWNFGVIFAIFLFHESFWSWIDLVWMPHFERNHTLSVKWEWSRTGLGKLDNHCCSGSSTFITLGRSQYAHVHNNGDSVSSASFYTTLSPSPGSSNLTKCAIWIGFLLIVVIWLLRCVFSCRFCRLHHYELSNNSLYCCSWQLQNSIISKEWSIAICIGNIMCYTYKYFRRTPLYSFSPFGWNCCQISRHNVFQLLATSWNSSPFHSRRF